MWPFSRKYALVDTNIFQDFTDYHSHILPGVDDGIGKMEEALGVLKAYSQLGVRKVWLTPHIMEDIPNTPDKLRNRFHKLQEAYEELLRNDSTLSPISLNLSAENMIDSLFIKRLEAGELLPYGDKENELLLETSYVQAPNAFHSILKDVKEAGYTPVLAHPERYQYMSNSEYESLRASGVKFQLNILSLIGAYGPSAQQRAEYLLSNYYYNYKGTDIHSLQNFMHLIKKKALKGDKTRFTL